MATRDEIRALRESLPAGRLQIIPHGGGPPLTVGSAENICCSVDGQQLTVYDHEGKLHQLNMPECLIRQHPDG